MSKWKQNRNTINGEKKKQLYFSRSIQSCHSRKKSNAGMKKYEKLCTKAVKKILVKFQTYWYCLTCSQCILHIKYFLSKGSWPQSGLCSLWFFLPSTLPILLPSWSLGGVSVVKTILNWVLTNHRQEFWILSTNL